MDVNSQQRLLQQALNAQQREQPADAQSIYEKLLKRVPDNAQAVRQLAKLKSASGDRRRALRLLEQLVVLEPNDIKARHDLALLLAEFGQLKRACVELQQADRLQPGSLEILNNLGCLLKQMGQLSESVSYLQQAALIAPENAVLYFNLGSALREAKRLDEAIQALRTAATLDPKLPDAWAGLGATLLQHGLPRGAVASLRRALELKPDDDESLRELARALHLSGQFEESLSPYTQAVRRHPERADVWYGLGRSRLDLGHLVEAIEAFRKCLALDQGHAGAMHECGKSLFKLGCVEESMTLLRQAAAIGNPELRALALQNMAVIAPGNPADTNQTILEIHRAWGQLLPGRPAASHPNLAPSHPLRIGYVSSFFHRLNWMKPVWALVNRHDRQNFEIHLFSDAPASQIHHGYRPDPRDRFHDISGQSNERVAEWIAAQQLDVLVDLNGYSAIARFPLYALRPAPIIVGWFNMYATTGMDCFDYLIGDEHVIPASEEACYTERILRVPHCYLTFEVDHPVPDVTPPPVLETGQLTIGCLASQYKITDQVVETWAGILRTCQNVRLLIRNAALGRPEHQDHFRERFATRGISSDRLILEGPGEHFDFLSTYNRIDFAVDSFPYSGGTTTMEALWQGVPVVTFSGDRWVSRTSVSLVKSAGLHEFVGSNIQEYTEICIRLANSPETPSRLQSIRTSIRERLRASPVCDSATLATSIERLYRQISQSRANHQ
jgi:protein O-GlcNAc transferase